VRSSMVVVVADEQSGCLLTMSKLSIGNRRCLIWTPLSPLHIPRILFQHNSAGIFSSIWQVPLPKLIPPEFPDSAGFQQESVGDSKDLVSAMPEGSQGGDLLIAALTSSKPVVSNSEQGRGISTSALESPGAGNSSQFLLYSLFIFHVLVTPPKIPDQCNSFSFFLFFKI
jgi:hypothetical protein